MCEVWHTAYYFYFFTLSGSKRYSNTALVFFLGFCPLIKAQKIFLWGGANISIKTVPQLFILKEVGKKKVCHWYDFRRSFFLQILVNSKTRVIIKVRKITVCTIRHIVSGWYKSRFIRAKIVLCPMSQLQKVLKLLFFWQNELDFWQHF